MSVYLFAFLNLPIVKQSPDNFFTPLALAHSLAPTEQTGWWIFIVLMIRGTVFPYCICVHASCLWASLLYTEFTTPHFHSILSDPHSQRAVLIPYSLHQ